LCCRLSKVYGLSNNTEKAFNSYKKYIAARNSLFDEGQMKQMVQTEMLYNLEKEMQQTKLEQAKRYIQVKEETRRQKLLRNFLIFAF